MGERGLVLKVWCIRKRHSWAYLVLMSEVC